MKDNPSVQRMISLGFAHERVPEGQHLCYIYNDDDERKRTMARYVESGLLDNDRILYMVDSVSPSEMEQEMAALGVELRDGPGQLTVDDAKQTYAPKGILEPESMWDSIRVFCRDASQQGFAGVRGSGEMGWCLDDGGSNLTALMAYEAGLNLLVQEFGCTCCCQYDARRFDGQVLMDVLAVHPTAIVRGQLVHNPFYVPPQEFLANLDARYSAQHA